MPCHPDRVRANYVPSIPDEIVRRYRAGERRIVVTPGVLAAYGDSIVAMYRVAPQVESANNEKSLAYKDARVVVT